MSRAASPVDTCAARSPLRLEHPEPIVVSQPESSLTSAGVSGSGSVAM